MDDPEFKRKYQKYKLKVKLWEKDFKKKHGRIPSKYDIREASREIRDSYKMYYKMKTSFLENTLSEALIDDDGFDIFDTSQGSLDSSVVAISHESLFNGNTNNGLPTGISFLLDDMSMVNENNNGENTTTLPTQEINLAENLKKNISESSGISKESEPVEFFKLNENAWSGNEKKSELKTEAENKSLKKSKLFNTAKLFNSSVSTFTKRNPRKSLSSSRLSSGSLPRALSDISVGSEERLDVLPDLETILFKKCEQRNKEMNSQPLSICGLEGKKTISTELDKGWLERCTMENETKNVIIEREIENTPDLNNAKSEEERSEQVSTRFGISNLYLENVNLPSAKTSENNFESHIMFAEDAPLFDDCDDYDRDSVVGNSEDEEMSSRQALKRRRKNLTESDNNTQDKTIETRGKKVNDAANVPHFTDSVSLVEKPVLEDIIEPNEPIKEENKPLEKTKGKKSTKKKDSEKVNIKPDTMVVRRRGRSKKANVSYHEDSASNEDIDIEKEAKPTKKRTSRKTGAKAGAKSFENEENNPAYDEPESHASKYEISVDIENISSLPRLDIADLVQMERTARSFIEDSDRNVDLQEKENPGCVDIKRIKDKEKLEKKIQTGKLNENFVALNMKKKVFVRGKKTFNYSKYKKKMWKQKKQTTLSGPDMDMRGCDGGVLTCFKCGMPGHFAQKCTKKEDALLPIEAGDEEESSFPTLEEAGKLAEKQAIICHSRNPDKLPSASNNLILGRDNFNDDDDGFEKAISKTTDETILIENIQNKEKQFTYIGHKIPEEFLKRAGLLETKSNLNTEPLYKLNPDGSTIDVTEEVLEVLQLFGYKNFRKGQDKAIMRILSGLSTLVTLSTGSGKSLCYQLPAYLYSRKLKRITLVISPLVSLMEDQVHGVSNLLRAACLHTNQTKPQKEKVLEMINEGNIDVLLISPEAVVAGERSTGFGSILRNLPPIAFACIDEAHCVSQWSHNFRPSYLMICKVLKNKFNVRTILGLTATATLPTKSSIICHLNIVDGEKGVISDIPLPDNLILTVSMDMNRDEALLNLLQSKRFETCHSIIIYCIRRDECERVASFIRTCMQDTSKENTQQNRKRKRGSWYAEPYHAGMPSSRRRTIQNAFMRSELRIVVATIAFGMGINKPDIRAVIHYNMPKNFESYVQEIGRAGRDGKVAHCHLFLDPKSEDRFEHARHIYANSIDRHVIRKLLQKVFIPCSCAKNLGNIDIQQENGAEIKSSEGILNRNDTSNSCETSSKEKKCPKHEVGFSVQETVQSLDIPEENISTLLCYLELDGRWFVEVLSNAYTKAKVICYGGSKLLKQAAKSCPPLAVAVAMEMKKGSFNENSNVFEFSVIEIASAIGWNSGVVKYQLKNLEWTKVNGLPKRSSISVTFDDLGFRVLAPGDFKNEELDEALDTLYNRVLQQERTQLIQLQNVYKGLYSVSSVSYKSCCDINIPQDKSDELKKIVRQYFQNDYREDIILEKQIDTVPDEVIINDVRTIISMYPENNFTGRAIARIFHGIQSPNFPAVVWARCKHWRAHSGFDFNRILKLANKVIVQMRS